MIVAVQDIKPLTGVRFIAAMAVVLLHMRDKITAIHPSLAWTEPVICAIGHTAVPFFFVLSGFILAHVYFPGFTVRGHGRFVWLRFARIWPVHVAMIVGLLAYVGAFYLVTGHGQPDRFNFGLLAEEVTLFRGWYDSGLAWNAPAWSISAEWFAYLLVFPLCGLVIRPMKDCAILALVVVLGCHYQAALEGFMPAHTGKILSLFVAGTALLQLRASMSFAFPWFSWLGLGLFVVAVAGGAKAATYLSFAFIILGLSYERCWLSRLLSHRWLVYGGQISFALYMSHWVVNVWVREACKQAGTGTLIEVLTTLAVTLAAAAAVHHLIELPANRWLRKFNQA